MLYSQPWNENDFWQCKHQLVKRIASFQSWFVPQNQDYQLHISTCNFTIKRPRLNLRRLTSIQECHEEYCTVNIWRKPIWWWWKQPSSKWISSFQSWFVCQKRGDQLRITFCNFTKTHSFCILKCAKLKQVRGEECLTVMLLTLRICWWCKIYNRWSLWLLGCDNGTIS